MHSKLLTFEANEALNWLIDHMPEHTYESFSGEMEEVIRKIAVRFGLNESVIKEFKVDRLVFTRDMQVNANNEFHTFEAKIYSGEKTYAIIDSGKIFHRCHKGNWRPSNLTLAEVIERSVTRIIAPIKIKAKYL